MTSRDSAAVGPPPGAPPLSRALLAVAWLASTVALRASDAPGAPGGGFGVAVAATVLSFVAWAVLRPRALVASARASGPVAGAAAIAVLAYVIPAAFAGAPHDAVLACGRVLVIATFGVVVTVAAREGALRTAFAWAGATLLALYVALFALGIASPSVRPHVFLTHPHEHLGTLPRFAALTGIPASTGTWALLALGLAEGLPSRWARLATRTAGVAAACATLSVATLAVPSLVAAATLPRAAFRRVVVAALAVTAVAALQVHVLSLELPARSITVGTLPAGYATAGLGPALTPVREVRVLGVGVRLHATLYGALATKALGCFVEHPFAGVGPAELKHVCAWPTMNTYGVWRIDRSAHNQFLGFLAENGVVGIALAALALVRIKRSRGWSAPSSWSSAAAVALLICGCGGDMLITLPAIGFLSVFFLRHEGGAPTVCSS